MPNTNGGKQHWQSLYDATSVETDRGKLLALINQVEAAIMNRAQELALETDHTEERAAMAQASQTLLAIKTEKLGWPPIETK
jgi:hypothetical protein